MKVSVGKVAVSLSAVLLALQSFADLHTWTGAALDNKYATPGNWDPAGPPALDDSIKFDPGTNVELNISGDLTSVKRVYVYSGRVTINSAGSYHYTRPDGEFYVEDGAELYLAGSRVIGYNPNRAYSKTGGGVLRLDQLANSGSIFSEFTVAAGTLVFEGGAWGPLVTVKSGAVLKVGANGAISGDTPMVVSLEEGGELVYASSKNSIVSAVTGLGTICGGGTGALTISLASGPQIFAGTTVDFPRLVLANRASVAAESFTWTITNPLALEDAMIADQGALRFDVETNEVMIGAVSGNLVTTDAWRTQLPTQTVGGEPLTVRVGTIDVIPSTSGVVLENCTNSSQIVNSADPGTLEVRGNVTLADANVNFGGTIALAESAALVQRGGTVLAPGETDKRDSVADSFLPGGVQFDDPAGTGLFRVESGEAYVNGGAGMIPRRIEVTGGALTMVQSAWYGKYSSAQSPSELYVDGGRVNVSCRRGGKTGNASPYNLFRDDFEARIFVGAGGGTFAAIDTVYNGFGVGNVGYTEQFLSVNKPIECAPDVTAGPLDFRGWVKWRYNQPVLTGGALRFLDGWHLVNSATALDAQEGAFFGSGPVFLRGAMLGFNSGVTASNPLKFASLTYAGAAELVVRHLASDGANAIEIGSLARAGKGSALFIDDATLTVGQAGGPSVKVTGGVPVDGYGFVTQPIYADKENNAYPLPFKYDAEKGLVATTTDDFETFDRTVGSFGWAKIPDKVSPYGQEYSFAGLYVAEKVSAQESTVFKIGDGTNPAYLGFGSYEFPLNNGTIDFGTSEGIVVSRWGTGSRPRNLDVTFTGQSGISFLGCAQETVCPAIRLKRANTYTGGTYVSGSRVCVAAEGALSTGPVEVLGGELAGGSIWFEAPGTYANDFTIGGFGRRVEKYNADPFGALVFREAVTITGDVVLTEPTRVSVDTNLDSRITGTVSGDRLCVYSFISGRTGVLELAGHNTYSGGTEILQQSVAIREADGFGTGPVRVEKGALVFRNDTAITVPNAMSGHDVTLRYDGAGAVTLANAADLGVTRVEVTPGEHAFAALPAIRPLVSTAERPRQRAILVLKAGGTYALTQADLEGYFEIVLEDGATLDLGGGELTVFRFTGKLSDVNGTIVETNPKGGVLLIVR